MSGHLYSIGDNVKLQSSGFHVLGKNDTFVVVSQMPPFGGELQYRIKSRTEPHERVVTEDRLSRLVLEPAAE